MKSSLFGSVNGVDVYKRTLKCGAFEVDVIDYGCIITAVRVTNASGQIKNAVLCYETLEGYLADEDYLGAVVGRFSNRIANGEFTLNGKVYHLSKNEGKNNLHGGVNGFNKKIWKIISQTANTARYAYLSVDREEGFPGNLQVEIEYTVTENSIAIEYFAKSDADTVVSLTNHSYFNPDGTDSSIDSSKLFINADYFTVTDKELIPHGELKKVNGTAFDFRQPAPVRRELLGYDALTCRGFYDDNFVLNGSGFRKVATLYGSQINMDVFTDRPGLQVYTEKPNAVALETQNFPNAINCENFPSAVLKKGQTYNTKTIYKFYLNK